MVTLFLLAVAGCQQPTALYKPGLTVEDAVAEYDAIALSVMSSGPLIRTPRDEIRVFNRVLARYGFAETPVADLPPGVVVRTHPAGITQIAGLKSN